MAITLSTTYKETLTPEIVEIVDNLVEDGYDLENVLIVLDYFGEEYYEHFEQIFEILEDTGADNEELYDYLQEFDIDDLEYFPKYQELNKNYDENAVKAFLELHCPSDLERFEDVYRGYFDNVREFVEHYMELHDIEIPSTISIDYEGTWESNLRFDFEEEDGYYFDNV
jgi:hypothetical protein